MEVTEIQVQVYTGVQIKNSSCLEWVKNVISIYTLRALMLNPANIHILLTNLLSQDFFITFFNQKFFKLKIKKEYFWLNCFSIV